MDISLVSESTQKDILNKIIKQTYNNEIKWEPTSNKLTTIFAQYLCYIKNNEYYMLFACFENSFDFCIKKGDIIHFSTSCAKKDKENLFYDYLLKLHEAIVINYENNSDIIKYIKNGETND